MRAREVIKMLHDDGWYYVGATGSHKHYKHPTKPGKITVPDHPGDLDKKTVKTIREQAGLE
jgi:predicted RNA binding protein YcfA (HicA-like mRNA interferase family)